MANIAYYRVSSVDQSIAAQQHAMQQGGIVFDEAFKDEGVSGATLARDRPGFAAMLKYIRKGDTLYVYAVDRLGRDALDVQGTVRYLIEKGVQVNVRGLGVIGTQGVGELILAVLAQVADMERHRIIERTQAGRDKAKADGKHLGRHAKISGEDAARALLALEQEGATATAVAQQFGISRQVLWRLQHDQEAKHAIEARKLRDQLRSKTD